jgi:hypothetical protein
MANTLTMTGGTIDGVPIGNTTAAAGTFTTLKVTGGTPGTGKVLTSDATGGATWQAASGGGATVYNSSGAAQSGAKIVIGTLSIGANTTAAASFSGSAIFGAAPICTATNATSGVASTVRIEATTTSSITIFNSNAGSAVTVNYHCIGS